MKHIPTQFDGAWWKACLRRHFVPLVAAVLLLLTATGGYLAGLLVSGSSPKAAAAWTVRTVSARTSESGGTDVVLSPTGPWVAQLVRFDRSQVRSVVYWVRDARNRWRSSQVAQSEPFEAQVNWWEGDNSGYEVVTAHVTMRSGRVIKDPGGWHWINGLHASPGGSTAVQLNSDGSAGAMYAPARHGSVISRVEFWLASGDGHWTEAGTATAPDRGVYSIGVLTGTQVAGWNGSAAAVSVHVVWPNGSQFVDPDPWVRSGAFASAPAPPTVRPAPATAAPKAQAPPPAQPAPPAQGDPNAAATAAGATAVCADGTLSFSAHRSGTCSFHGGVHWWTGNLGPAGPGGH
jgi:Protein of unknown function (DUF3761)